MSTQPSVAHRFADAFHGRDPDRMTGVFTTDAEYHDLFYGVHHGHDGIRALFGRMFAEGRDHRWEMATVVDGGATTIAEWRFTFTVAGSRARGGNRTLTFDGTSVFATRDGLCHAYREYFDRGAALLAVGVAPDAVARIVRRRPTVAVGTGGGSPAWATGGS